MTVSLQGQKSFLRKRAFVSMGPIFKYGDCLAVYVVDMVTMTLHICIVYSKVRVIFANEQQQVVLNLQVKGRRNF